MDALQDSIESILLNPVYRPYLAILKAARNGAVYGAKVRFPHALVMVFLFRKGTLRQKINLIIRATRQHARNLALFAVLYKTVLLLLRQSNPYFKSLSLSSTPAPGSGFASAYPRSRYLTDPYAASALGSPSTRPQGWQHFVAGLVGGYYVFGRGGKDAIKEQIVVYVFARVVLGLGKLSVLGKREGGWGIFDHDQRDRIGKGAWPVFAACSWGGVMWLFAKYPDLLQASLRSSMTYIYKDSEHWDSARNFLVYNK